MVVIIRIVNPKTNWNLIQEGRTREKCPPGSKIIRNEKGKHVGTYCKLPAALEGGSILEAAIIVRDEFPNETSRFWGRNAMEVNSHLCSCTVVKEGLVRIDHERGIEQTAT